MPIFEEIQALLAKENPFVCYVKPNATHWNLLQQKNDEIIQFSGQSGIVFAPFDTGLKVVIPMNEAVLSQGILGAIEKNNPSKTNYLVANQKEVFEELVTKGIQAIKDGNFEKVVLSRKIEIQIKINISATVKQ